MQASGCARVRSSVELLTVPFSQLKDSVEEEVRGGAGQWWLVLGGRCTQHMVFYPCHCVLLVCMVYLFAYSLYFSAEES